MQASNRIIVNTLAQYIRTILNLLLSLYSARLVLDVLGIDDFGIYSLVAGVVSMLSFLTNSLVGSTQRFLSVSQGQGDINKMKEVFCNSLLLHLFLGLLISIVLEVLTPFLFNGFLNIPAGRENAASAVYQLVILMVYVSFIASPYRALLVSHENIVYVSILDVMDGVFKVVFVILMTFMPFDKLITYACIMLLIRLLNLFAFAVYTHIKYEECIIPRFRYLSKSYIKDLLSYTGWVVYSSACIALRTQGLAIVLNKIMGAAINAAYGIGAQIAGMVSFVSSSFNNALAPQLMSAEGGGKREHMLFLAKIESKFSFLLLAMVGIPTMFEMKALLGLWLVEVPPYSTLFGCMFLSMQIVDMLTSGLGSANRAMGKIGLYTFLTFTPKLLALPMCWIALESELPLYCACLIVVIIELVCMLLRMPLLNVEDFSIWNYSKEVIFRSMPPVIISSILCFLICLNINNPFRFILTYAVSIPFFVLSIYVFSLTSIERNKVKSIICRIVNKY